MVLMRKVEMEINNKNSVGNINDAAYLKKTDRKGEKVEKVEKIESNSQK